MNPLYLLRRRGNRNRTERLPSPPPPPLPVWVWKCSIHFVPGQAECPLVFNTAPELRRHYIRDHRMSPADVSLNQQDMMIRKRLPEGQEQLRHPSTRSFIRSENFDPRWPTGPVDDAYGPWMVRRRGPVGDCLQEARDRREQRNSRGRERMFVPDWYYDEISRRVRMARGQMWG